MRAKPKKDIAFVFDWDGVILKKSWRNEVFKAGARLGYPMAVVIAAFPMGRSKEGYSPRLHAKILALGNNAKAKKLEKAFLSAMAKVPRYIVPAARRTLAALKQKKFPLYVLSAGERGFQGSKVKASKLGPYFKKIYIVPNAVGLPGSNKADALKKIARSHSRVVFMDDWIENILVAHRTPQLKKKVITVFVDGAMVAPKGIRRVESIALAELRRAVPEAEL